MNTINKTDILSTMRVECQTKKEKTNTNTVEQIANVDEPKSIHGLIRFSSIPPDAVV